MHAICDEDGKVRRIVSAPAGEEQKQLRAGEVLHRVNQTELDLIMSGPSRIVDGSVVTIPAGADVNGVAELEARGTRDQLLKQTDWTQLDDAPCDRAAWASYRAALRDLPEQDGWPVDINWPASPAEAEGE